MKKLEKLKLDNIVILQEVEQRFIMAGSGPWSSWDSIPGGTILYCQNDATYVANGTQIYELKTGSTAGSTGFSMSPTQVTIGSSTHSVSKQTLVQWYDSEVNKHPDWDPFPQGSIGHTLMEYWSAW